MQIRYLFTAFFIFLSVKTFSQSTLYYTSPEFYYREGLQLLNEEKYGPARQAFATYLQKAEDQEKKINAQYYVAYTSIQLENNDAESLVEEFINKHPSHPKAKMAYFELGNLKYDRKQYKDAIKYYEKIYFPNLSAEQESEARFKLAYSYFTQQDFDKAYNQFDNLKRSENKFKYASNYYSGYINFQKEEYDRAYYDFQRAEENEYYASIVPELINKTLYKQKRYDELIEYATKKIRQGNVKNSSEFYLYLAEAYYKKSDFENATTFFNQYLDLTRKTTSPEIMFRIADAKQRAGDIEGAIEGFKKSALEDSELGQLSSFYLGNLYVKNDQKELALAAYSHAREKEYNPDIQQKAHFLFAKVAYDLGNYEASIEAFKNYLDKYPNAANTNEINELLTDAYFRTNDYDAAIRHFEQLKVKSEKVRRAYQQITFNEGARLFNNGDYYKALDLFEKSIEFPVDKSTLIQAHLWAGETYYLIGQTNDAKNAYAAIFRLDPNGSTDEYLKARYAIGYVYYNDKEYDKALHHFKYYVDHGRGKANYDDALIRLADTYYTTKQYDRALATYDQALSESAQNKDYAYFQKGVINGINNNIEAANRNFDQVINNYPRSVFIDDALFQRSQFNFENGNYNVAIDGFSRLISAFPNSPYVPYALQSRALAYANVGNHQASANDYKAILNRYPTHETAENAILGLQKELAAIGQSDQFSQILSAYKSANPNVGNLETVEYESAKTLYYDQKYSQAVSALQNYLDSYPNSANKDEAYYFLGDAYFRMGNYDQALQAFKNLENTTTFGRYNRVIERMAEIELLRDNYNSAIRYLRKSEKLASNKKGLYTAWSGLLESYYNLKKYDSVDYYAENILDKALVTAEAENKALLYLGKSAYERKLYDPAIDYFLTALNTAKDEYGAEAQYLLARIYYEQGKYQNSIETLFNLNKNFSMYEYWLGKSFLLLSDNYLALDETFQAKATLESIIENATLDEIVNEAKQKLQKIEANQEKTTNAPDTLEIVNPE